MIIPKNILKFWGVFFIILAVALGVITLIYRWHRIFPTHEVSEIYSRYAKEEGIDAAFVKDYRVNDTITVDVTLLEATDSAGWTMLKEDFGIVELEDLPPEERELVRELFSNYITEQSASPDKNYKMPDTNICKNDVITCERSVKRIAVFHTANLANPHSVEYFIYDLTTNDETLNIQNHEQTN